MTFCATERGGLRRCGRGHSRLQWWPIEADAFVLFKYDALVVHLSLEESTFASVGGGGGGGGVDARRRQNTWR